MNKIKLFLISNMYPSEKDKFYGIFVRNFVDGFNNTNVEITSKSLIYGRGKNNFNKIWKYVNFYSSILKNVLKFNYDLIYVHYPNYVSLPLLFCLPLIKNPIILNFHGTDVFAKSTLAKVFLFLVKPIVRRSHTIVVPSKYFRNMVAEKFNISSTKIFVSPSMGIDIKKFNIKNGRKNVTTFTLGYVGRIDKGKGLDILLNAIVEIKDEIPNLQCLIAGNGKQVKKLNKKIIELEIRNTVSFVGSVPYKDLPDFYNKLDLFVFPTQLYESLGLVGIEALACGVPVIGSKIGGLQDYIIEGENGAFFEPGNDHDLACKIISLYNNPKTLTQMKENTRRSVNKFDNKLVSEHLISKIRSIV